MLPGIQGPERALSGIDRLLRASYTISLRRCEVEAEVDLPRSFFKERFRFLASQSGNERPVSEPETVYTLTSLVCVSFILAIEI